MAPDADHEQAFEGMIRVAMRWITERASVNSRHKYVLGEKTYRYSRHSFEYSPLRSTREQSCFLEGLKMDPLPWSLPRTSTCTLYLDAHGPGLPRTPYKYHYQVEQPGAKITWTVVPWTRRTAQKQFREISCPAPASQSAPKSRSHRPIAQEYPLGTCHWICMWSPWQGQRRAHWPDGGCACIRPTGSSPQAALASFLVRDKRRPVSRWRAATPMRRAMDPPQFLPPVGWGPEAR